MRSIFLLACGLTALAATAYGDPVEACRDRHPGDDKAYVACLESALRAAVGMPAAPEHEPLPDTTRGVAAPAIGMGAEQLDGAADRVVSVRIVSVAYNSRGLGTFRTEDGQVWRETMPSPERRRLLTGREYTARIERGKFGGYRLFIDGVRHMKTVERIE